MQVSNCEHQYTREVILDGFGVIYICGKQIGSNYYSKYL